MSRLLRGRLVVLALITVIGVLTFLIPPAVAASMESGTIRTPAQTPTVTETVTPTLTVSPTPTVMPTPTPTAGTSTTTANEPTDFFKAFLILLLLFGLALIIGLLIYLYNIQQKYYTSARILSQIGAKVTAVQVVAFPPEHVERMSAKVASGQPPQQLKIDGPGIMAVGIPGEFTATDPSGKPADKAQWSLTPASVANLNVTTGQKITVSPLSMGSFKLQASIEDQNALGEALVAVVAPQANTEDLPFVGQGYGALVIAVLIVVAVLVLALTGILQGEAVATLLGGLLGYIFGVSTSSGITSKAKNPTNGGS